MKSVDQTLLSEPLPEAECGKVMESTVVVVGLRVRATEENKKLLACGIVIYGSTSNLAKQVQSWHSRSC
jgi:23S rRNA A2030 N6-methylase RlmJ